MVKVFCAVGDLIRSPKLDPKPEGSHRRDLHRPFGRQETSAPLYHWGGITVGASPRSEVLGYLVLLALGIGRQLSGIISANGYQR